MRGYHLSQLNLALFLAAPNRHLRQLMLNPLKGHAQTARSIHNPDLLETLRELAAMDGAFVVSRRGVVDSAGTYLDAPVGRGRLRPGLGARHAAALAPKGVRPVLSSPDHPPSPGGFLGGAVCGAIGVEFLIRNGTVGPQWSLLSFRQERSL